jgi:hypothetical protein
MHSLTCGVHRLLWCPGTRIHFCGWRLGMDAEYLGSGVNSSSLTFAPVLNPLRFLLPDLTPNPGLWWYFFTEMFDHFRPFFLAAFSVSESAPELCLCHLTCCLLAPPSNVCRAVVYQVSVSSPLWCMLVLTLVQGTTLYTPASFSLESWERLSHILLYQTRVSS